VDVLVAGGGPAGAIAALVLARAGAQVTVFDRARFPRDKLCGDSINPGALAVLSRLGLEAVTGGGVEIRGMIVSGERGVRVRGEYRRNQHGISLPRRILDARLIEAAAAAGARIEEGVVVRGPLWSDDERSVKGLELRLPTGRLTRRSATVTIAADGLRSRLARASALARTPAAPRRWAVGGIFQGVDGGSHFGEMHVRTRCYIGLAPLAGGLTNACVVTDDRASLRNPDVLVQSLHDDPQIRARFERADLVTGPLLLGPLAVDVKAAGMPGMLLAGDAAGFIDPMTGDGVRFAFRGGELAALEALRALAGGWQDAHQRLASARRTEFGAKWRFNRMLRSVAASPRAILAASHLSRVSPALLQYAVRYAGDTRVA
jgi:flavin-dependent dehydrogenase